VKRSVWASCLPNPPGFGAVSGVGAVCAICHRPASRNQIEIAIEFARTGPVPGLDKYHLHLRCFAAWELERSQGDAHS
jgi:hypothetical protein